MHGDCNQDECCGVAGTLKGMATVGRNLRAGEAHTHEEADRLRVLLVPSFRVLAAAACNLSMSDSRKILACTLTSNDAPELCIHERVRHPKSSTVNTREARRNAFTPKAPTPPHRQQHRTQEKPGSPRAALPVRPRRPLLTGRGAPPPPRAPDRSQSPGPLRFPADIP